MDKTIHFDRTVTTYAFYTKVLNKLAELQRNGAEGRLTFDFTDTRYINPSVVPILLAFGDYVQRLYKLPSIILYNKGSDLHGFFLASGFHKISEDRGIFDWGSVSDSKTLLSWKNVNKVSYNLKSYKDADKIKDPIQRRNYIFDCLRDRTIAEYRSILEKAGQLSNSECEDIINSLAEIGTNSIMYSKTLSFSYVSFDRYQVLISMADSGIGFEGSFQEYNRRLEILDKYKGYDINFNIKFKNYFVIMSALKFSYDKHLKDDREDLWTLRTNVVRKHGTFKIQYENTQVIFSHSRCGQCKRCLESSEVFECVGCLLKDYCREPYSPIKIYRVIFPGVRVEISFDRSI